MKKKNTLTIVAFTILAPLIISNLIHYFQKREKKNEVITITVPTSPVDRELT